MGCYITWEIIECHIDIHSIQQRSIFLDPSWWTYKWRTNFSAGQLRNRKLPYLGQECILHPEAVQIHQKQSRLFWFSKWVQLTGSFWRHLLHLNCFDCDAMVAPQLTDFLQQLKHLQLERVQHQQESPLLGCYLSKTWRRTKIIDQKFANTIYCDKCL